MEDLFLNIVRESEARPGARRVSGADASSEWVMLRKADEC